MLFPTPAFSGITKTVMILSPQTQAVVKCRPGVLTGSHGANTCRMLGLVLPEPGSKL